MSIDSAASRDPPDTPNSRSDTPSRASARPRSSLDTKPSDRLSFFSAMSRSRKPAPRYSSWVLFCKSDTLGTNHSSAFTATSLQKSLRLISVKLKSRRFTPNFPLQDRLDLHAWVRERKPTRRRKSRPRKRRNTLQVLVSCASEHSPVILSQTYIFQRRRVQ